MQDLDRAAWLLSEDERVFLESVDSRSFGFLLLDEPFKVVRRKGKKDSYIIEDFRTVLQKGVEYYEQQLLSSWNRGINPERHCKLGHLFLLQEDYSKALKSYQKYFNSTEAYWQDAAFLYGLGLVYFNFNALAWSSQLFKRALEVEPTFSRGADISVRLGQICKLTGDLKESQEHLEDAYLSEDVCSISKMEIGFHLAHVEELKGNLDAAEKVYISLTKQKCIPSVVLAAAYRQLGWVNFTHASLQPTANSVACSVRSSAAQYLKSSLEINEGDGHAWYYLGRVYSSMEQSAKAYTAYRHAVQNVDVTASAWLDVGTLYRKQGQPQEAMQAFVCSLQVDPTFSPAWVSLGLLYESQEQLNDALYCYARAADRPSELCGDVESRIPLLQAQIASIQSKYRKDHRVIKMPLKDDRRVGVRPVVGLPPPKLFSSNREAVKLASEGPLPSLSPASLQDSEPDSHIDSIAEITSELRKPLACSTETANHAQPTTDNDGQNANEVVPNETAKLKQGQETLDSLLSGSCSSLASMQDLVTVATTPKHPLAPSTSAFQPLSEDTSVQTPSSSSQAQKRPSTAIDSSACKVPCQKVLEPHKRVIQAPQPTQLQILPRPMQPPVQPVVHPHSIQQLLVSPPAKVPAPSQGPTPISSVAFGNSAWSSRPVGMANIYDAAANHVMKNQPLLPNCALSLDGHSAAQGCAQAVSNQQPKTSSAEAVLSSLLAKQLPFSQQRHAGQQAMAIAQRAYDTQRILAMASQGQVSLNRDIHQQQPTNVPLLPATYAQSTAVSQLLSTLSAARPVNQPATPPPLSLQQPGAQLRICNPLSLFRHRPQHTVTSPQRPILPKPPAKMPNGLVQLRVSSSDCLKQQMIATQLSQSGQAAQAQLAQSRQVAQTQVTQSREVDKQQAAPSQLQPMSQATPQPLPQQPKDVLPSSETTLQPAPSNDDTTAPMPSVKDDSGTLKAGKAVKTQVGKVQIGAVKKPVIRLQMANKSQNFTWKSDKKEFLAEQYMCHMPRLMPPIVPTCPEDSLHPDVPIIRIRNEKEAHSKQLRQFCLTQHHPIVVVKGLVTACNINMEVVTTKYLVECHPNHIVEVRLQKRQGHDENWDLGKKRKIWPYISDKTRSKISEYGKYQHDLAKLHNCKLDETCTEELPSVVENTKNGRKLPDVIQFGTNIDLSNESKFALQVEELQKLPAFCRVHSSDNMLNHIGHTVLGMNSVQLYMKVPGSRTPGHQENNNFCSVNINVGPGDCMWYGVHNQYWGKFHAFCEKKKLQFLTDSWWPVLEDLVNAGIPVYRFLQKAGDMVWVNTGCVHWVQAEGFCNNVAWNVGPMTGHQFRMAHERYQWNIAQGKKSFVPVIHLAWNIFTHSIRMKVPLNLDLSHELRPVLERSLAKSIKCIDFLTENGIVAEWRPREPDEVTYYCHRCEIEVFNLLFSLEINRDTTVVFCEDCARSGSNPITKYHVFQQFSISQLKELIKQLPKCKTLHLFLFSSRRFGALFA